MFAKYSKTIIEIVVLQLAGILQTLFLRNYFKLDSTSYLDTLIKSLQHATLLLTLNLFMVVLYLHLYCKAKFLEK